MVNVISVASAFSTSPGPRYRSEGKFSGQQFREEILEPAVEYAIENNSTFLIDLDGVSGYGVGFLEEVFGGFVRCSERTANDLVSVMTIKSKEEPYLIEDITEYIQNALRPAKTYQEPHWFTGKIKTRCSTCHKVTYKDQEEAEFRAKQISERTPMRAYKGDCQNWHVTRK